MIDCLIFSKDRACQLDALLQTIDRHAPMLRPTILYSWSDRRYHEGYRLLRLQRAGSGIEWIAQPAADTFALLTRYLVGQSELVCLLVDDDLFYAPACEPDLLPWSWRPGDYDYPFALDGCVYESGRILSLLDFPFANPTQLEAGVAWRLANAPEISWQLQHGEPCLVGVPHNRVSVDSGMPTLGGSAAELNDRFLAGGRIDPFATMAGVQVDAVHMPIEYKWRGNANG